MCLMRRKPPHFALGARRRASGASKFGPKWVEKKTKRCATEGVRGAGASLQRAARARAAAPLAVRRRTRPCLPPSVAPGATNARRAPRRGRARASPPPSCCCPRRARGQRCARPRDGARSSRGGTTATARPAGGRCRTPPTCRWSHRARRSRQTRSAGSSCKTARRYKQTHARGHPLPPPHCARRSVVGRGGLCADTLCRGAGVRPPAAHGVRERGFHYKQSR